MPLRTLCSRCRWWCQPVCRLRGRAACQGRAREWNGPRSFRLVMPCGLPSSILVAAGAGARRTAAETTALLLDFLDLHQEAFEFRCKRVWINDRRRQLICQGLIGPAFIFCNASEAPVNGDADLERLFAVDLHGPDAARDHGFRDVVSARAGDFYFFAAANAHA